MHETATDIAKRLEAFETPEWAARAILTREILTPSVIDPCTGTGILAEAARAAGYNVLTLDIHDWGYEPALTMDWLDPQGWFLDTIRPGFSCFLNPPFSRATDFIEQAFTLGARKVVCFQRQAFWESRKRRAFWEAHPPSRVYVCGDRADCWRFDLTPEERTSGTTTAHAFYVWEQGHPPGTLYGHLWRDDV